MGIDAPVPMVKLSFQMIFCETDDLVRVNDHVSLVPKIIWAIDVPKKTTDVLYVTHPGGEGFLSEGTALSILYTGIHLPTASYLSYVAVRVRYVYEAVLKRAQMRPWTT